MTTTKTTQSPLSLFIRFVYVATGWAILIKIRRQYGKRAFWLAYATASCFSSNAGWNDQVKKWNELKEQFRTLRSERQERLARQEALRDLTDRIMGRAGR